MTLEEAAKLHALNTYMTFPVREAFIAGAKWFQQNHSCCCAGCEKHNISLTTEKQNSEFPEDE